MSKLTMVAAFGAGYVLGAHAGRERYEQIAAASRRVTSDPRVQRASSKAADKAKDAGLKAAEAAKDGVVAAASTAADKVRSDNEPDVPDTHPSGPVT